MSFPYGYYQPYYQQQVPMQYMGQPCSHYTLSNVAPIEKGVSLNPSVAQLMHELTNSPAFMRVAPRGSLSGKVHVEPTGIYLESAYQRKTKIYQYGSFDPYLDAQIFKICQLTAIPRTAAPDTYLEFRLASLAMLAGHLILSQKGLLTLMRPI
ncbi:hypothetical protein COB11_07275 [Candidatus Aerophobetes bacterium]|uniref:Uncharacterized protein n=1 Tax=Aerophobetes bacterium TaxID=2030807 RepID=A0A2A4YCA2_UNCAE|nr:MAG: hypothetical protein COB11_07275 [Candidatus Aerophobetes bacterium]